MKCDCSFPNALMINLINSSVQLRKSKFATDATAKRHLRKWSFTLFRKSRRKNALCSTGEMIKASDTRICMHV